MLIFFVFEMVMAWFLFIFFVVVIFFVLFIMISWFYYGLKVWIYFFGENKINELIYKVIFCVFVVIGLVIFVKSVFDFGDVMIFVMCFFNVMGFYVFMFNVMWAYKDYMRWIKFGEIVIIK